MRERIVKIGNAILEFLKVEEECEDCVFSTKYMDSSIGAYLQFRWLEHHFYMRFDQRGGGIQLGEMAKHGCLRDSEVAKDTREIPFLGLDGVGPIGRVPSQCSVDILHLIKSKEGKRDEQERVLRFENPSEVHLLPPECVQRLDEILIQDVTRFLKHHFRVWKELGKINLNLLTHPRACY